MKPKLKIILAALALIFSAAVYSQNITNTLGTSGSFKIKDGVTTYFTLTQSNGYVELNKSLRLAYTTNSTTGIIFKNTSRFIHDYTAPGTTGANVFIGLNSGNFTLSGTSYESSYNIGLGNNTLSSLTTGYSNIGIGNSALDANTTGTQNTGVGHGSMGDNISGSDNSAFGNYALANNTIGTSNSAFGSSSLFSTTTGLFNTALGSQTLYLNTTGSYNTAIGYYALSLSTAGSNTAVGYQSLSSTTTGYRVTALGYSTLTDNTIGYDNTAIGYNSLSSNSTGYQNTSIGSLTGENITTGHNLTLIGFNTEPSSSGATNQITLGNNAVTSLRCNVQTITSLSDGRDKKNVTDLSFGLSFLMKIKPRQFNWDRREWYDGNISDGSKMEETTTAGFIAQELDEVQSTENADWLKLVLKDNPEKWEATYGNLLPVMVKAIQELKEENDKIQAENEKLKNEIEVLKSVEERLTMLELTVLKNQTLKEVKSVEK